MAKQCNNPLCRKRINQLEGEISRLRSVGLDMLKQRGNWQASGTKPAELGLEFDSLFTHEIENVSEILVKQSAMESSEARRFLSTIFQDAYETCKHLILNRMCDALSRVLVLPEEQESNEELYDICRAYGLLLNATGAVQFQDYQTCSKEVCNKFTASGNIIPSAEFEDLTKKMAQLSWNLLGTVPPLVSSTLSDVSYSRDWHEKEMDPEWNGSLSDYKLVYYRPILFFSYEGKVSQKGWVGNRKLMDHETSNGSNDITVNKERKNKRDCHEVEDMDKVTSKTLPDPQRKSYKKPFLRIQGPEESESCDFTLVKTADLTESSMSEYYQERETSNSYLFGLKPHV